jgi:hypothetical protein
MSEIVKVDLSVVDNDDGTVTFSYDVHVAIAAYGEPVLARGVQVMPMDAFNQITEMMNAAVGLDFGLVDQATRLAAETTVTLPDDTSGLEP